MTSAFRPYLLVAFILAGALEALAEIRLPAIISSHMVLQRNTTVTIWGWADAGESLTIDASWLDNSLNAEADSEGNWLVKLQTTDSRDAQTIHLKSPTSDIQLEDILFGEVWLCSGQSNMYQPVRGYNGQPTFGSQKAITTANNNQLRLFMVERQAATEPSSKIEGFRAWEAAHPGNVSGFSAVAYFFGQQLQEILDVPVGMIHTSWGGSLVEAWISEEALRPLAEIDLSEVDLNRGNRFPTVLYNAMIHPLIPYAIKGALWYQGESNRMQPQKYTQLFPAMVEDWRTRWGIGEFPFYYAQIAPFLYGNNEVYDTPANSAFIREAQLQCLDLIPNSGIAIAMDIGEPDYIHPPKKKEVADRLLYNALHQTYGLEAIDYAGPVFDSLAVTDQGVVLYFKNAETGLYAHGGNLEGFDVAGADKVFYPATAKIVGGSRVLVQSNKVSTPLAVRYAWRNWIRGTLYDTNLLPASSFRTDDWEDGRFRE